MRCAGLSVLALVACGPGAATPLVGTAPPAPAVIAANGEASPIAPVDARAVADLAAHATQILSAYGNRSPAIAHDGRTLVFVSTRDGVAQLYASDALAPRSEVRRLVTRAEAITSFTILPRGTGAEELVFGSGKSNAPFAMNLDGTDVRALTTGPALDYGAPISVRPGAVLLTARDRTHAETQLHELATRGGAPARVLYTDPDDCRLVDVTADGAARS